MFNQKDYSSGITLNHLTYCVGPPLCCHKSFGGMDTGPLGMSCGVWQWYCSWWDVCWSRYGSAPSGVFCECSTGWSSGEFERWDSSLYELLLCTICSVLEGIVQLGEPHGIRVGWEIIIIIIRHENKVSWTSSALISALAHTHIHTHTTICYPSNKFAAKKHLQISHIMCFFFNLQTCRVNWKQHLKHK